MLYFLIFNQEIYIILFYSYKKDILFSFSSTYRL